MEQTTGEVCIANISPRERRKRLISGFVMLAASLILLVILLALGASRWWRLVLFPIFAGAASGYFQWRDKTWVSLSARGSRNLYDKVEKIEDENELTQVRRQAFRVQIKSLIAAIPLTLIALAIP